MRKGSLVGVCGRGLWFLKVGMVMVDIYMDIYYLVWYGLGPISGWVPLPNW